MVIDVNPRIRRVGIPCHSFAASYPSAAPRSSPSPRCNIGRYRFVLSEMAYTRCNPLLSAPAQRPNPVAKWRSSRDIAPRRSPPPAPRPVPAIPFPSVPTYHGEYRPHSSLCIYLVSFISSLPLKLNVIDFNALPDTHSI